MEKDSSFDELNQDDNLKKDEIKKEYLIRMNELLYKQLTFAEQKNGILTGLIIVILPLIIGFTLDIDCKFKWYWIYLISCLFISLMCSISSFYPSLEKNNQSKETNIYFWRDIKNYGEDVGLYLNDVDHADHLSDLANQNIQLSKIINKKIKLFTWAVKALIYSLVLPPIIYLFIYLFMRLFKKLRMYLRKKK